MLIPYSLSPRVSVIAFKLQPKISVMRGQFVPAVQVCLTVTTPTCMKEQMGSHMSHFFLFNLGGQNKLSSRCAIKSFFFFFWYLTDVLLNPLKGCLFAGRKPDFSPLTFSSIFLNVCFHFQLLSHSSGVYGPSVTIPPFCSFSLVYLIYCGPGLQLSVFPVKPMIEKW